MTQGNRQVSRTQTSDSSSQQKNGLSTGDVKEWQWQQSASKERSKLGFLKKLVEGKESESDLTKRAPGRF